MPSAPPCHAMPDHDRSCRLSDSSGGISGSNSIAFGILPAAFCAAACNALSQGGCRSQSSRAVRVQVFATLGMCIYLLNVCRDIVAGGSDEGCPLFEADSLPISTVPWFNNGRTTPESTALKSQQGDNFVRHALRYPMVRRAQISTTTVCRSRRWRASAVLALLVEVIAMTSNANFQSSPDGEHRYWQRYETASGGSRVCLAIMFNPTGKQRAPGEHGATIRNCLRFAEHHGCGALLTCNLFARKDYPDGENREPLPDPPDSAEIQRENDRHIDDYAARADIILCAWGQVGPKRTRDKRARDVLAILAKGKHDRKMYALGINRSSGQPTHPAARPRPDPEQAFRVCIAGGQLVRARQ